MSFSPIDFIFIGCMVMMTSFVGYSEISILNPQTRYFQKNVMCPFLKSVFFGGMTSKIEFEQNGLYGYVLYYGLGLK